MRWTRVLLAAALALGAAPAAADGTDGADGARLTAERRAEWLAERARLAADLPYAARYDAAQAEAWAWHAELTDAGDLDGDGKGDLVDLRSQLTWDDTTGFTENVRVDAYRGFDGKALWSLRLPPASFAFPVVTKTGLDGKQGLLVMSFTEASQRTPEAGAAAYDTTVASYDGAGIPLWARPLDGLWAESLPGEAYADHFFEGIFDAVPGGGTDVLVSSTSAVYVQDPAGAVAEARSVHQLSIVDGATGAITPLGPPITDAPWGVRPRPVGDLDKDKRADVLVEAPGKTPTLTGIASSDGRRLWQVKAPDGDHVDYVDLPDVTGDGVADFGAVKWTFGGGGIIVIGAGTGAAAVAPAPAPRHTVSLYDGSTGRPRWTKPGSRVLALGDIDRKRGAEVAVGGALSGASHGFTAAAFTGSGKRLWSVTRKMRAGERDPRTRNSWGASSDVHGDGVNDIGYAVVGVAGKRLKRDEGLVDGRTGRVSRDPRPGMYLTRAALDGRGADAYLASATGRALTFDAWRGDAPSRLWSLTVRAPGAYDWTTAASVDGDRCGDLALALVGDAFTDVVVSGGTGKPLWTLTRADDAPATVGKASVVTHKVYRRGC